MIAEDKKIIKRLSLIGIIMLVVVLLIMYLQTWKQTTVVSCDSYFDTLPVINTLKIFPKSDIVVQDVKNTAYTILETKLTKLEVGETALICIKKNGDIGVINEAIYALTASWWILFTIGILPRLLKNTEFSKFKKCITFIVGSTISLIVFNALFTLGLTFFVTTFLI